MDKAQSLLSLARLCERPNPSGNINCAIFATLHPEKFSDAASAAQYARPDWTRNGADWLWLREVGMPNYTDSLDAAMTLVPEGCLWSARTIWDGCGETSGLARIDQYASEGNDTMWRDNFDAFATTPAQALCAAALRAIAAEVANVQPA